MSKSHKSNLLRKIMENDQDTYRITSLKPFNELTSEAQEAITELLNYKKDRVCQVAAIFLYGLISIKRSVVVVSSDDMNDLVRLASEMLGVSRFKMTDRRKDQTVGRVDSGKLKTLWSGLTGFLLHHGIVKIIKEREGNVPGVFEIIDSDWLKLIGNETTDEQRLQVINATSKQKYKSFQEFDNAQIRF